MKFFNNPTYNYRYKKLLAVMCIMQFFILQSLFFNLQSINAQTATKQSIRVTPIINDLKLIPGKTTLFSLSIENISQQPLGIHAQLSGFDITEDAPFNEQKPSEMIPWTRLSSEDILLDAQEKKTITVTIAPPSNAKQNGYYETIFLTPILHQQQIISSPIILSRIGVLVLGTIGNLNASDLAKKVSIQNITPSQTILNNFPNIISFTVTNSYFTHFDAKPFITITPLFETPQTTELSDKHVLPGGSRVWQYQLPAIQPNMFYQIHIAVSVGGGKQIFKDTWFVVVPYLPILIIVIIALLLLIVISKRHRFKKFVSILIRG